VEVGLDYAFVPYSILGDTHRITINIMEGGYPVPLKITLASAPSFVLGQGSVDAAITVKNGAPVDRWKIDILDASGKPVKTLSGKGKPPDHFVWDGKNEKGDLVPKGKYSVQMEA